MRHRYLFILEVVPLEIGRTYDELPSHLTLMSRFFSTRLPHDIEKIVQPLFARTKPIDLIFGEMTELGPRHLIVHIVEHSDLLKQLHAKLRTMLDSIDVEYEYPQFIGEHHKPHITQREGVRFNVGAKQTTSAAYLVEIIDGKRVVRARFALSDD